MSVDLTKLIPTDIWRNQIETPQQVDEAIRAVEEGMAALRARLRLLRSLRKISVGVYGEPIEQAIKEQNNGRQET